MFGQMTQNLKFVYLSVSIYLNAQSSFVVATFSLPRVPALHLLVIHVQALPHTCVEHTINTVHTSFMATRIQLPCSAFLVSIIGCLRQMSPSMAFAGDRPVFEILFCEILFCETDMTILQQGRSHCQNLMMPRIVRLASPQW